MCGSTESVAPATRARTVPAITFEPVFRLPSAPVAVAVSTLSRATFCGSAPWRPGSAKRRGRMFSLSTGTRFSLPVGITTLRCLRTILPSSA